MEKGTHSNIAEIKDVATCCYWKIINTGTVTVTPLCAWLHYNTHYNYFFLKQHTLLCSSPYTRHCTHAASVTCHKTFHHICSMCILISRANSYIINVASQFWFHSNDLILKVSYEDSLNLTSLWGSRESKIQAERKNGGTKWCGGDNEGGVRKRNE